MKDIGWNENARPVVSPLETASQAKTVGLVVGESWTSSEFGGRKGEDALLGEGRHKGK